MTLVVHHLNNSRSQHVLWLLEELGVPYEIVRYQRDPETLLAPESLRREHPLGKSPVVTDGDLVLAESGAIVEYLADRYGEGRLAPPPGTPERLRYTYWLHHPEGSAMPPLLLKLVFARVADACTGCPLAYCCKLVFARVADAKAPFFVKPVAKAIANKLTRAFIAPPFKLHLDYMEAELAKNAWFVGHGFSAVDIQMSLPIEAAAARGGLDPGRPRLRAWLDRIHARAAYQRALECGGPYALSAA
jgi:glutathione S-transferase